MRKKVKVLLLFVLMVAAAFAVKNTADAKVIQYKDVNRTTVRVNYVQNGAVDFDVLYKGVELDRGVHYRLSQCDIMRNNNEHIVSMTIEGIKSGGYMGTKFQVVRFTDGKTPVTVTVKQGAVPVDGKIQLLVSGGSGGYKFSCETPSTASVTKNTGVVSGHKSGLAKITVTDTNNCSTTAYFAVHKKRINTTNYRILYDTNFNYSGKRIQPPVVIYSVTNGRKTLLRRNFDFSVNYSNNKNVGTGNIVIRGINGYTGGAALKFQIKKVSMPLSGYIRRDEIYAGQSTRVVIDPDTILGRRLVYSSSNTRVARVNSSGRISGIEKGTATITVTAKGTRNIKGSTIKFRLEVHSNGTKITSLTSKRASDGSYNIYIKWKRYDDVDGYEIHYKRSGYSGNKFIHNYRTGSVTMTDCRANTTYSIRIRTYWYNDEDRDGNNERVYSPWSSYRTIKTSTPKPSAPSLKTVRNPSGTRNIYVTWSKVSGADGYQVEYKNLGTGYVGTHSVGSGSATSTTITSLSGKNYRIRVRAYVSNNGTTYSNWSGSKSVSINSGNDTSSGSNE
jgi:hypothetical protein